MTSLVKTDDREKRVTLPVFFFFLFLVFNILLWNNFFLLLRTTRSFSKTGNDLLFHYTHAYISINIFLCMYSIFFFTWNIFLYYYVLLCFFFFAFFDSSSDYY